MTKQEQKMKPLFYTLTQVCDMLNLSQERVVAKYIKTGKLKHTKTSGDTGHYRIHRDKFDRFMRDNF